MSFSSIGLIAVLAIIGLLVWGSQTLVINEDNKRIYTIVGVLQVLYLIIFLTGLLDKISQSNVYVTFGICAVISIVSILLSIWMLLPFSFAYNKQLVILTLLW